MCPALCQLLTCYFLTKSQWFFFISENSIVRCWDKSLLSQTGKEKHPSDLSPHPIADIPVSFSLPTPSQKPPQTRMSLFFAFCASLYLSSWVPLTLYVFFSLNNPEFTSCQLVVCFISWPMVDLTLFNPNYNIQAESFCSKGVCEGWPTIQLEAGFSSKSHNLSDSHCDQISCNTYIRLFFMETRNRVFKIITSQGLPFIKHCINILKKTYKVLCIRQQNSKW